MKKLIIFLILFFLFSSGKVIAVSDYVLPYPSAMPGSILYKPGILLETVRKYWHFGNFSQFKYNLNQSDKYLVEAKTLFEYKQYLLGHNALKKSDYFFRQAPLYLRKAKVEGKDSSAKQVILQSAAAKHTEVLKAISGTVPERVVWQPENETATEIKLQGSLRESIQIRERI